MKNINKQTKRPVQKSRVTALWKLSGGVYIIWYFRYESGTSRTKYNLDIEGHVSIFIL